MTSQTDASPFPTGSRDSTLVIHGGVRESILSGELPAQTWISQVELARQYGVSRGPVREALRLLEREGLIETAVNQRCRVAPLSVEDLEQLYATRIVNEALAISVTVPLLGADDTKRLYAKLDELDALAGEDIHRWDLAHREFHAQLVKHAGERMRRLLEQCYDHAERYRRVYITGDPRSWSVGAAEHRQIVDACAAGDVSESASLLARHLARTALSSLALIAPEHEPLPVRAAVRQVTRGAAAG